MIITITKKETFQAICFTNLTDVSEFYKFIGEVINIHVHNGQMDIEIPKGILVIKHGSWLIKDASGNFLVKSCEELKNEYTALSHSYNATIDKLTLDELYEYFEVYLNEINRRKGLDKEDG